MITSNHLSDFREKLCVFMIILEMKAENMRRLSDFQPMENKWFIVNQHKLLVFICVNFMLK